MGNHTLIAVDVAKSVFEIVVSHQPGKVHERARVPRNKFLGFFVQRPAATVVMGSRLGGAMCRMPLPT